MAAKATELAAIERAAAAVIRSCDRRAETIFGYVTSLGPCQVRRDATAKDTNG
jgi:hypothetical protein